MENQNHFYITPSDGKTQEVVIRHGQAAPVILPKEISIKGDFNAVSNWMATNESTLDKHQAIFTYDTAKKFLSLDTKPQFPDRIEITAYAELFKDLVAFGINQEKFRSKRELEQLVKMNRFYFSDAGEQIELLNKLQKLSLKIDAQLQDEADKRGNKNQGFSQNVTSDIPLEFKLTIPVFQGMPASTFRVEICYDVTDRTVRFWLESVELRELEYSLAEQLFGSQVEYLKQKGFVVICK